MLRSPKLHAAYESKLPELPEISDDIGHILVHYLHTGNYESLKPKEVDTLAKQIAELRTSIRAYATARAYDLPELMRLAEKNIEKYGEGISLPLLLEITKEAHPGLSEADGWFLGYLKSRIRPHLEDPKALLGSNLLDQISSILSPNRVLLRTVLEMFCERINPLADPLMSAITSPSSSRPVSPSPRAASPASVLQLRSKTVPRDEPSPPRKKTATAAPWPLAEDASSAPSSKETTPEPSAPKSAPPVVKAEVKSTPKAKAVTRGIAPPAPEPIVAQPVTIEPRTVPSPPAIVEEIKAAIDSEMKPAVMDSTPSSSRPSTPARKRQRKDSAKVLDTPPRLIDTPKSFESPTIAHVIPELEVGPIMKDLESVPEPLFKTRPNQRVLREVDSGFWDFTPIEQEPVKESTPSIIEIDPEYVLKSEPVHELHASPKEGTTGVDARDFAATPEPLVIDKKDKPLVAEIELPLAPEVVSRDPLDSFPELEPEIESDKSSDAVSEAQALLDSKSEPLADSKALDRISEESVEPEPEKADPKEDVGVPLEKVELPRSTSTHTTGLTVQEPVKEPAMDLAENQEPKPEETETPHTGHVSDHAEPAGPSAPKTTEPVIETPIQEPAGEAKDLDAQPEYLAAASDHRASVDKPVPAADPQPPAVQDDQVKPIVAHQVSPERTKSWRKRFMRYPVLFGRGN